MLKRFPVAAALLIVIIACTDEKSTAGGVVDPNTVAENLSSSSSQSAETILTEQHKIVMDSILGIYGTGINGGPASIPSEVVAPTPTTSSSKTVNLFRTTGTGFYSYENQSTFRFCRVKVYKAENGVKQEFTLVDRSFVNSTFYIGVEQDLYEVEAIANYYMTEENSCKQDSLNYVQRCIDSRGAYRDYNRGCHYKHLQMSCIFLATASMNLDSTARHYQGACEKIIPEIDYVPKATQPVPQIACTGVYGIGNDDGEVCDEAVGMK